MILKLSHCKTIGKSCKVYNKMCFHDEESVTQACLNAHKQRVFSQVSDIFSYHGQTMHLLFYLGKNFLIVDLRDFFLFRVGGTNFFFK